MTDHRYAALVALLLSACSIGPDPHVSCGAQGFECGYAWLGCGAPSDLTDCGSCADPGTTCNPFFNRCEPACSAAPSATLCSDARASRGVECGIISNGCGGYAGGRRQQMARNDCLVREQPRLRSAVAGHR